MSVGLAAVERWFAQRGWYPFAFQREVWRAFVNREHGLIHSATGTGKTLAAFLGPVAALIDEYGTASAPPLSVLWITPMRALAADTRDSLMVPLADMGLAWTVGLRTGDTSTSERAKQDRRMPTVLVTTPESLALMLTRSRAREDLQHVRAVVVDEWHELMGNKRGVQTELGLARVKRFAPAVRIWGLSATLGNLDEALPCLLGAEPAPSCTVAGVSDKQIVIDTLIPPNTDRFPWAGHLGLAMLEGVAGAIEQHNTTLVFINTRSQAELWYQGLLAARPEWAGDIALHHGALDAETRRYVERGLKQGMLKAVIATSSLDLGVDFSPVERVLQVGSAKGVARLLQRAGRSGHQPGSVSRVSCVPAHAFEFVEAAAARRAAAAKRIESRRAPRKPLDLLVQHLVTLALGEGFVVDELLPELRTTYAYRDLTDDEFRWALDFVTRGGGALKAYPEFHKVVEVDGIYRVTDAQIARRHRMSVGTIVSDASMDVRFMNGKRLGSVEEGFIAMLDKGDAFVFAGRTLELIRVENMTAYVRPAKPKSRLVPRWQGQRMSLTTQLASSVREVLDDVQRGVCDEPETRAAARPLALQRAWSRIPRAHEFLLERLQSREGFHVFGFPFEGRAVHTGLAALLAYRLGEIAPRTFSFAVNDYGFEILCEQPFDVIAPLGRLLSTDNLLPDMLASLNAAELAKRHFREIARVAGLVFQGYPGQGKSNKQLQATSGLIFDVFRQWDPHNPLLGQAQAEVLERELELARLSQALTRLQSATLVVTDPLKPTPFAFPLMLERLREKLSSEKLSDRIAKMQLEYDSEFDHTHETRKPARARSRSIGD